MKNRYYQIDNRDVSGILLLDKPTGFSSSFLLNKIKKMFLANKAGYVGTLDPLATGMLPICFGKATKFAKYLSNTDKRYKVTARLGESTDTFDSNGVIVRVLPIRFNVDELKKCLVSFVGRSYQVPPMFSSLKYRGVPLYKYARKGIDIPRKARIIYIYNLTLIAIKKNVMQLDIRCSKGTYIRSIIHDIGENLGCGAHVIALRRVMVGKYTASSMVNIMTIESVVYNFFLSDMAVLKRLDKFLIPINICSVNISEYL